MIHNGIFFKETKYQGYFVSKCGQILSTKLNRITIIKQTARSSKSGYLAICLCFDGKVRTENVHRVVAETWINRKSQGLSQVNHKDGDKKNNHADNLEWTTPKENTLHAHRNGLADISNRRPIIDLNCGVFYTSIQDFIKHNTTSYRQAYKLMKQSNRFAWA